jgi:hypothetical protein
VILRCLPLLTVSLCGGRHANVCTGAAERRLVILGQIDGASCHVELEADRPPRGGSSPSFVERRACRLGSWHGRLGLAERGMTLLCPVPGFRLSPRSSRAGRPRRPHCCGRGAARSHLLPDVPTPQHGGRQHGGRLNVRLGQTRSPAPPLPTRSVIQQTRRRTTARVAIRQVPNAGRPALVYH